MPLSLDTPIQDSHLRSLTRKVIARLKDGLAIETVLDLLFHLPVRYEELGNVTPIKQLAPKTPIRILAIVQSVKQGYTRRGALTNARVEDPTGKIDITWFNQPWVAERIGEGDKLLITGKLTEGKSRRYIANPDYEIVQKAASSDAATPIEQPNDVEAWNIAPDRNVLPIYPETEGVTSRWLNFLIQDALKKTGPIKSALAELTEAEDLMPLDEAIHAVHLPKTRKEAEAARERVILEELVPIQCAVTRARFRLAKKEARALPLDAELIRDFLTTLPFSLTEGQRTAAFEILSDMERERPMHRLLVGDVGSGKTIVAAIAALNAARAGVQVAVMAPTEILATQHFESFTEYLKPFRVRIGLLTGSGARVSTKRIASESSMQISKPKLHKDVAAGEIDIVIGTHALIVKPKTKRKTTLKPEGQLKFRHLGLAITDEQHRFGVNQRAHLAKLQHGLEDARGSAERPHFLTMTATPIPRTLALTLFGDLDLSTIKELPQGRKPVETSIIGPRSQKKAYALIEEEVEHGRQAFVICPLVEESDKVQAKAAVVEYERLKEQVFPNLSVGLLHGQMKAKEKNDVMQQFAKGKIDVLVATSVVEVGIDVPNATVMAIEGAERFGLSQLYQMRGRVGRGEHKSYCLLMPERAGQQTKQRLSAMLSAESGAAIAEADLAIRGPGELIGTRQSGIPDTAMQALGNLGLIEQTRDLARALLKKDPNLKAHPTLAKRTRQLETILHLS